MGRRPCPSLVKIGYSGVYAGFPAVENDIFYDDIAMETWKFKTQSRRRGQSSYSPSSIPEKRKQTCEGIRHNAYNR